MELLWSLELGNWSFWSLLLAVLLTAPPARPDPIDAHIRSEMQREHIPGLALAVVKDGKLAKSQGYGLANVELNAPATTNTVFEIGSITKQFTATLIMMLAEEGKLTINDKLRQHLSHPGSAGVPPAPLSPSWNGITLRHLLTHTSGITNYNSLNGFEVTKKLKADTFIHEISKYPLMFSPGQEWSYCNSAYNLLGYIIEKTSGKPYWIVLHERIFQPAGMLTSQSRNQTKIIPNRASGYEWENGQLVNRDSDLTDVFSAGAIVSTVLDMVKWDAAIDSDKLLSRASREEMWKPTRLNDGRIVSYGFGWRLENYKGHKNIGHGGSTSGFSATFQKYPENHLTVIVLCNLGKQGVATEVGRGVADLFFDKPKN